MSKNITKNEKVVIVSIKMGNGSSREVVVDINKYHEVLIESLAMNPGEIKIQIKDRDNIEKKSWLEYLTRPAIAKTRAILRAEGFTPPEVELVMKSYNPEHDITRLFSHYPAKAKILIGKIAGYQISMTGAAKIY